MISAWCYMFRFILCAFLFAACGQPPTGLAENEILAPQNVAGETGQTVKFQVETVAANLEVPWAIAFAPDNRTFFTERPAECASLKTENSEAIPFLRFPMSNRRAKAV